MSDKTLLWDSVCKTDPSYTKEFTKSGGFKGTAINALYLIHKATEKWGPMGGQWGVEIVREQMLKGAPILVNDEVVGNELVHCIEISLRYPDGKVPAFGQTMFVGKNKYGPYTDEDAPKKSLTDALTKALSWLGFSADIHMGRYDDNKYVSELKKEFRTEKEETLMLSSILQIEELAKEAGVGIEKICSAYGVSKLSQIRSEDYIHIINRLKQNRKAA